MLELEQLAELCHKAESCIVKNDFEQLHLILDKIYADLDQLRSINFEKLGRSEGGSQFSSAEKKQLLKAFKGMEKGDSEPVISKAMNQLGLGKESLKNLIQQNIDSLSNLSQTLGKPQPRC